MLFSICAKYNYVKCVCLMIKFELSSWRCIGGHYMYYTYRGKCLKKKRIAILKKFS